MENQTFIEEQSFMDEDQAAITVGLCIVALIMGLMIGITVKKCD
jgi:hypothetical protein